MPLIGRLVGGPGGWRVYCLHCMNTGTRLYSENVHIYWQSCHGCGKIIHEGAGRRADGTRLTCELYPKVVTHEAKHEDPSDSHFEDDAQ